MKNVLFQGKNVDRIAIRLKADPDTEGPSRQQELRERKQKEGIRQLQLETRDTPGVRESLKAAAKVLTENPAAASRLLTFARDCRSDERLAEQVGSDVLPDVAWRMVERLNDSRTRADELEVQELCDLLRERPDLRDVVRGTERRGAHLAPVGIPPEIEDPTAALASLVTSLVTPLVTEIAASSADLGRTLIERTDAAAARLSRIEQTVAAVPESDRRLAALVAHLTAVVSRLDGQVTSLLSSSEEAAQRSHRPLEPQISAKARSINGGVELLNELLERQDAGAGLARL